MQIEPAKAGGTAEAKSTGKATSAASQSPAVDQDGAPQKQDAADAKNSEPKKSEPKKSDSKEPDSTEADAKETANGKEAKQASEASAEPTGYVELLNAWIEVEGRLKAKEAEFVVVGETRKAEIRNEYDALLEEAKTIAPKLRNAAMEAYEQNPNQDSSVVRLLVGMLTDDLARNRDDQFFALGQVLIDGDVDVKHFEALKKSKRLVSFDVPEKIDELIARHEDAAKGDLPRCVIKTSYGDIVLELFEDSTPNHVANFIKLASSGFYKDSAFHRVDPSNRVIQGGKPADEADELDYTIAAEWEVDDPRYHFKGHLGMARTQDPNSASSEFYIMTDRFRAFDGNYTVFGRVISGMEFVNQIKVGDKILDIEVTRKRDHDYEPVKYDPEAEVSPITPGTKEPPKSDDPKKAASKKAEDSDAEASKKSAQETTGKN